MRSLGCSVAFVVLLLLSVCSAFLSRTQSSHHSLGHCLSSTYSSSEEQSETSREEQQQSPWKMTFNFGRERGSYMPEEWGSLGARLVFDLPIQITSDRPSSADQVDPMLQRNSFRLNPLSDTKYITMEGEQRCAFAEEGEWKVRLPLTGKARGEAAKFMCFVDLKSDIGKKDITLKKGERIYLTGKCWREEELERALNRLRPIQAMYKQKQQRLKEALEHETGDRRLDGTDPLQTLKGMKDTAKLVLERDEALRNYREANRIYPTIDAESGVFPSAEELEWQEGPWVSRFRYKQLGYCAC